MAVIDYYLIPLAARHPCPTLGECVLGAASSLTLPLPSWLTARIYSLKEFRFFSDIKSPANVNPPWLQAGAPHHPSPSPCRPRWRRGGTRVRTRRGTATPTSVRSCANSSTTVQRGCQCPRNFAGDPGLRPDPTTQQNTGQSRLGDVSAWTSASLGNSALCCISSCLTLSLR